MVSTGSYSEYSPLAVFESKELAQEYIDSYGLYGDFNDIEEIDFNPVSEVVKKDLYAFTMLIDQHFHIYNAVPSKWAEDKIGQFEYEKAYMNLSTNDTNQKLRMYILAKDQDHAIKICKDKAAEIKATVGWGNLINETITGEELTIKEL